VEEEQQQLLRYPWFGVSVKDDELYSSSRHHRSRYSSTKPVTESTQEQLPSHVPCMCGYSTRGYFMAFGWL
jgi:hypothetical protein